MKKLITSLLTLLAVTTPIGLSVVACNNNNENSDKEQQYNILLAINKATYNLTVDLENPIDNIKTQITPDYIKNQLSKELQKYFNDKLLKINEITINDKPLTPKDLNRLCSVPTLLSFNYGQFNAQTKLILQVKDLHKDQVIKAINQLQYQYINDTASSLQDLHDAINNNFVKDKLDSQIKPFFKDQEFAINKFIKDGHEIKNEDLLVPGITYITVNFTYCSIESNFTLKMILNPSLANEITNTIANNIYDCSITANQTVDYLKTQLTGQYFQNKLLNPLKTKFQANKFLLDELINKTTNKDLIDKDLLIVNQLDIIIKFTYADIQSQTTLKLDIKENLDIKITHSIANNIYAKTINLGTTVSQLLYILDANFIKEKLADQLKDNFNSNNWKILNLLNANTQQQLIDNDLSQINNLDVSIQFRYADIKNQTTLELNIQPTHDNNIINAISNTTYRLFTVDNDIETLDVLNQIFSANYIANQLSLSDQSKFKKPDYQATKLDIPDDFKEKIYQIAKLYFTYQGKTGVTNVFIASPFFMMAIMTESTINIKENSNVSLVQQQYWSEIKTKVLGNDPSEQKLKDYQLVLDTFDIKSVGIVKLNPDGSQGNNLTDADLKNKSVIKCVIAIIVNNALSIIPLTINVS